MTAVYDDAEVDIASDADLRVAVRVALDSIGLTYEELANEAACRRFSSDRAHRVWVAIAGLGNLA